VISYLNNYAGRVRDCLARLPFPELAKIVELLAEKIGEGKQILVFGNGGSAATASHFVCDLAKGVTAITGIRVKAIGLNDCIPLMTAWANDTSYEQVFQEPLANYLREGDAVIGITASGNSPNVLRAIEYANQHGGTTIGWIGMGGGKLLKLVKHAIVVESKSYEEVEDVHLVIAHMIKMGLLEKLPRPRK
jgi:D-sedoheptulose 7-phosphate isomerase